MTQGAAEGLAASIELSRPALPSPFSKREAALATCVGQWTFTRFLHLSLAASGGDRHARTKVERHEVCE